MVVEVRCIYTALQERWMNGKFDLSVIIVLSLMRKSSSTRVPLFVFEDSGPVQRC